MALLEHVAVSLDEYVAGGGGRGLERALAMPAEAVIDEVARSGLRGRGGAGFPTGEKWRAVRGGGSGTRYVVCNAAEGEPATFKDRIVMRRLPHAILEGLAIAAHAVGAESGFVAVKEAFGPEVDALSRAVAEMREAGALGGLEVSLVLGPDHYLFGEEKALLEVIEGREPLPRVLPPYIEGLFASRPNENPTVVNNVETLANVPWILSEGADWLRQWGTERSPGTMLFTVAGDVRREGVFELPLGTPLRHLVEDVGGGPPEGRTVQAVFSGSSTTVITPEQMDTPMDFDSMRAVGSGLGSAGFAVFDDSACMVRAALLFSRFLYVESCGQCPPCKLGSGEITAILERLEAGQGRMADLDTMLARSISVTDGQKCALPTGESLLMQSLLQVYWRDFRGHVEGPCPRPRELAFPKIVEYDDEAGRFLYDPDYHRKRPDWTYASA